MFTAADVPISADKLLILDKLAATRKAKVVFVSHDASIAKGPSTNAADIDATVRIYTDDATENYALFSLPSPWFKNGATVARAVTRSSCSRIFTAGSSRCRGRAISATRSTARSTSAAIREA